MLGPGSDPADYYLDAEPNGQWLGRGGQAAGLSRWDSTASAQRLRGLLAGTPPGADEVPAPTMVRADPLGRLDAKPSVDAIQARGTAQRVPIEKLFPDPADRAASAGLQARVERPRRGRHRRCPPARARQLA